MKDWATNRNRVSFHCIRKVQKRVTSLLNGKKVLFPCMITMVESFSNSNTKYRRDVNIYKLDYSLQRMYCLSFLAILDGKAVWFHLYIICTL